jgi:hypothetical protein
MLRLNPGFSLAAVRLILSHVEPGFMNRLSDALRKVGLPE